MTAPDPAPRTRRLRLLIGYPLLLVVVLAVVGAPVVVLSMTALAGGFAYISSGIIPATLASFVSRRLALATATATAMLVLLTEAAKPFPWAAGLLMAGVGLAIGACATRGWHLIAVNASVWPATFLIAPAFTAPDIGWASGRPAQILIPAALSLIGGLWAFAVGALIARRMPPTTLHPQPKRTAVLYGAGLAILLSVTAVVASSWMPGSMAGWVLLTIIVTVRPELADTQHRIWSRAAGTILGGLTAAALAFLLPVHGVLLTAGLMALTAVVAFQFMTVHYALYAYTLTLAIVLLSSPDTDVIPIDVQRVLFTLIGVVAVIILIGIATPLRRRLRRDDTA